MAGHPACAPRLTHGPQRRPGRRSWHTRRRGGPTPPNTSTPRARWRVHAGRLDATRRRRATPASGASPNGRRQRPHARRASRPGRGWDPRDWPRSLGLAASLLPLVYSLFVRYCARVRKPTAPEQACPRSKRPPPRCWRSSAPAGAMPSTGRTGRAVCAPRFSSWRESMTSRCCWLIQPATATTRNRNTWGQGDIRGEPSRGSRRSRTSRPGERPA